MVHNKTGGRATIERLSAALARAAAGLPRIGRRHTVCQQIRIGPAAQLMVEAGITDVWWAHAERGKPTLPGFPQVRVHPFPLYPVQLAETVLAPEVRPHLFSFVGAKGTNRYRTEIRRMIVEELGEISRGKIVERSVWHYQRQVYDEQVFTRANGAGESSIEDCASHKFSDAMQNSLLALCPSGTGTNSIRLWEAVSSGAIPVVLSDQYWFPGPRGFFSAATVLCPETREPIRALPDRLAAIASDRALVSRKLCALGLLKARYGRSTFVSDILRLVREATA